MIMRSARKCGKLVDIEMDIPAELIQHAERECSFKTDSIEFTLRGLCPDCAKI
jgi:Fe2+ or Zn2+ uptake regulation protein